MTFPPLSPINQLTQALSETPYDLLLYLARAKVYIHLDYHDLAVGDAYRALLLADEVQDDAEEYHELAREQLKAHLQHHEREKGCVCWQEDEEPTEEAEEAQDAESDEEGGFQDALAGAVSQCYTILATSLEQLGCLKSALDYCRRAMPCSLSSSSRMPRKTQERLEELHARLLRSPRTKDGELPDHGSARREIYPWNGHEPDRYSAETLAFLNQQLAEVAPKCEVRCTELPVLSGASPAPAPSSSTAAATTGTANKQLGLFAKADILAGEVFLRETSVITASNRLHDSVCDACGCDLSAAAAATTPNKTIVSCPDCTDTLFCTPACLALAQASYHAASCATDSRDASIARDVPAAQRSDALYTLLLARIFSMSITQAVHPLDLAALRSTWGDFSSAPCHADSDARPSTVLPFSMTHTITTPLHLLRALNVDIYASLAALSDTWIVQTVYAKLRATASARLASVAHRHRRPLAAASAGPDTAALHPLWCLANHDCDPNVTWAWRDGHEDADTRHSGDGGGGGGQMEFWGRTRSHDAAAGVDTVDAVAVAVRAGYEIKSHYCDIDLTWRERRGWLRGALGGWCCCARCVREEAEEVKEMARKAASEKAEVEEALSEYL